MRTHDQHAMEITDDTAANPLASTQGDSPQLRRLRRAVMSRVFDDEVVTPERIGRYEIARAIGSGAMGAVFAAHDPELDRRVAVKLLHFSNDDAEGKRLLREGKALAKLSHPNVVQVYDVGTAEGRVFLAMELVQGADLQRWLHAQPRSWRDVVAVFVAAGRGLAAAHAAGLVHRDFKPQNVLVGDDGVVKVADFGLVRAADGPAALPAAAGERALDAPVESLTRTGAAVGTPAYMSPEQHLVLDTDARTDQFSFCVALYEGLVGERPFRAERLSELIEQVRADRVEFPRRPWLPAALRRVIRRGLRARPADRFVDMRALIDALERAHGPAWRGLALGVAVAGLLPLVALSGMGLSSQPPEPEAAAGAGGVVPCDAEAKTRSIWGDDERERVRTHLVGVGSEIGERAAGTATAAIDGYLEAWREAYVSTCEGATTDDEAQVLARRLCLQARLQETRGVISVLAQADAAIAANVPQIVAALEPVAQCEGELAVVRTPGSVDDALRFELARARSLWHAGQPTEAEAAAESLAKRAAEVGDRMLESDAWLLAGMIAIYDLYGAERVARLRRGILTAALEAAQAVGDPIRMLRAEVLIAGQVEGDAALAGLERLAARVEASGDPTSAWAYHYERMYSGESEASRVEHARRLVAIASEGFGPGHRFVARSREIARIRGISPWPTAEQQKQEAEHVAAMFGVDSPRAVEELEALAEQQVREGKLDEARIVLERVVVAWASLVGPKSSQVGAAWRQIASLEWRRRGYDAALVAYEHAVAALEANPVTDHEGNLDVLSSVSFERAATLLELGRAAEAVAVLDEAEPRRHVRNDGSIHDVMWGDLRGQARLAAGDPEGALAAYAAVRKLEPAMGVELLDIGESEALLRLGRIEAARVASRRAWARLDERKDRNILDELQRARAGLALARTLAAIDGDDPEIAALAKAALASLPIDAMSPPTQLRLRDALVELGG